MGSWIHSGSVVCPACSSVCLDCSLEGRASEVTDQDTNNHPTFLQDHYDKREDLGNCFEAVQEEDPENLLLGFLQEFGDGFNLG